ncbi:54S ribosomal protein IMG1, mitochondrial [Balamuthia mandrillaris]
MQGCLRRSGLSRAFGTSCSLCGGGRSSFSSSLLLSRSQPTTRFYSVASSPSTISATNDLRAAAATPPKYFPDEVPGLYTARLRFPLQRLPLSDKASGYQPPLGNTGHLPFRVVRTKSGMLPVYRDYKNGRTKVVTIVRKFIGDTKALKQEIYNVLGGSANEIEIKERQGSLEIKGDYVWHLNIYLKKLGF